MDKNNKDVSFAEHQAREKALTIGKRYLNIFHQLHVITAGIETLNKDFLSLPDDVVQILPELAGGLKFYQHIQNLKSGATPINKIEADLLPFGKDVFDSKELFKQYTDFTAPSSGVSHSFTNASYSSSPVEKSEPTINSTSDDYGNLFEMLRSFQPTPQNLNDFKSSETIKDLGPNWKVEIQRILSNSGASDTAKLKKNFENLCIFDTALDIWEECVALVKNPRKKSREEIQSNLSNYQKYLNMFGKGGQDLYEKVKALAS